MTRHITSGNNKGKDYVVDFLSKHDSYWKWDGHKHVAELASGKLSDVFANCSPFFTLPRSQRRVAAFLLQLQDSIWNSWRAAHNLWFVGSAQGATGLAQSLAECARETMEVGGLIHDDLPLPRSAYTEPVSVSIGEDEFGVPLFEKTMKLKRFDLGYNPHVVLCEDVVSTFGTTKLTIAGIEKAHPDVTFCSVVLAIVDRSPMEDFGYDIASLVRLMPKMWDGDDDCPEEMKGCTPVRPKENWKQLTTEMQDGHPG